MVKDRWIKLTIITLLRVILYKAYVTSGKIIFILCIIQHIYEACYVIDIKIASEEVFSHHVLCERKIVVYFNTCVTTAVTIYDLLEK